MDWQIALNVVGFIGLGLNRHALKGQETLDAP